MVIETVWIRDEKHLLALKVAFFKKPPHSVIFSNNLPDINNQLFARETSNLRFSQEIRGIPSVPQVKNSHSSGIEIYHKRSKFWKSVLPSLRQTRAAESPNPPLKKFKK